MTLLFLFLLLIVNPGFSQVKGRVTDAQTGQPLAFVHIVIKDTRQGTMTDIDGLFSLELPTSQDLLQLSYVGYFTQVYRIDPGTSIQNIELYQRPYQLQEVVVYPGENPAHRIILNAIENRNANNPERLPGFTYNSYNKFLATLDQDFYIERWEMTGDSINKRFVDMLDRRHIFIMESVTERKFRSPGQSHEKIIANRVSGLQNPTFTMLATELQSLSFYGSSIVLLGGEYLSPLNRIAFNRYSYHLKDTLYQDNDSIYVVSFQPALNTNFDGLKGLLYINTHGWAIQNVIAQPAREMAGGLNFRIQQKYELINEQHWFPVQLNTDIDIFNSEAADPSAIVPLRMIGRSYIDNISINPPLRSRDFGSFQVDFDPNANKLTEHYWSLFRPDSLSVKERNTYRLMDSLGAANQLDRIYNTMEPLIFGELPFGVFNLPLNTLYRYNEFERHRIGFGLNTNRRFSQRIALGGHYAWGTGDKKEKYGYFGEIVLLKNRDIRLGGAYRFDVSERGGSNYLQQNFVLSTALIRNLYLNKMDYTQRATAYVSFLAYRSFLQAQLSAHTGRTFWTDLYYHSSQDDQPGLRSYRFSEASLRLRFAYGETLINTPSRVMRLPAKFPVFYLNVSKGFDDIYKGQLSYLRLEGRADISYSVPFWGKQKWVIEGGWTDNKSLPWPLLFTAKAANRDYFLATPFNFGTMMMNEFIADQYAAVFFQHNFQSLLFRKPGYAPELVFITNAGLGSFSNPGRHVFLQAKSWHKGYFESGLAINKLFPQRWVRRVVFGMSPGIEVLYRYGPYSLPDFRDNITVKLSIVTAF